VTGGSRRRAVSRWGPDSHAAVRRGSVSAWTFHDAMRCEASEAPAWWRRHEQRPRESDRGSAGSEAGPRTPRRRSRRLSTLLLVKARPAFRRASAGLASDTRQRTSCHLLRIRLIAKVPVHPCAPSILRVISALARTSRHPSDKVLVPAPADAEHSFETTFARNGVMAAPRYFDRKNCKQRAGLRPRISRCRETTVAHLAQLGASAEDAARGVSPLETAALFGLAARWSAAHTLPQYTTRSFADDFLRTRVLPERLVEAVDTTLRFALTPERG